MRLYLRNKATTEIREVEAESDEFRKLVKEVTPGGLSMWEQTSFPHVNALKERAADGALLEEDLGEEEKDELRYQALQLDLEGVAPEQNPHLALTPGEIESGLTPRDKLKDLQQMYDHNRLGKRAQVFDRVADRIADERREQPDVAAKGQRARAGGSDERENVPVATHRDEDDGDSDSDKSDSGSAAGSGDASSRVQTGAGAAKTPAGAGAQTTGGSTS